MVPAHVVCECGLSVVGLTNGTRAGMRRVREIEAGSVHVGMHSCQSDAMALVGVTNRNIIGQTGGMC